MESEYRSSSKFCSVVYSLTPHDPFDPCKAKALAKGQELSTMALLILEHTEV